MHWEKWERARIRDAVAGALAMNASYHRDHLLGFPGSFLDREVFCAGAEFLSQAPYLNSLLANPNHIGCHTLIEGEKVFAGTQALEVDALKICAECILEAEPDGYDGYIASGGTEANIQALWINRNAWRSEGLTHVAVLCSADSHYSFAKGCDVLGLTLGTVPVNPVTRQMAPPDLEAAARTAQAQGAQAFVLVLNMGTTMFGSVDALEPALAVMRAVGLPFRVHVDGAFGGFIYPFTADNALNFSEPTIHSVTLDAHKMLQAPYGTGIFIARKGMLNHAQTPEATYVHGGDYTLCGSRSGANAVAVWMILRSYGSEGGQAFVEALLARADMLCKGLDEKGISYFREPQMNVVTLAADAVPVAVAEAFQLVPDTHNGSPKWWKIVVMDHVGLPALQAFLEAL